MSFVVMIIAISALAAILTVLGNQSRKGNPSPRHASMKMHVGFAFVCWTLGIGLSFAIAETLFWIPLVFPVVAAVDLILVYGQRSQLAAWILGIGSACAFYAAWFMISFWRFFQF